MVQKGAEMIYPKLPDDGDDPSVAYKSLEDKGPIKQNRSSTNGVFIFVFIFFLTAWLGVGIYALCFITLPSYVTLSNNEGNKYIELLNRIFFMIYAILARSFLVIPSFMFFAAGLMFLYTLLLKGAMAKIFVYIAIVFMGLSVATTFLLMLALTYSLIANAESTCFGLTKIVVIAIQFLYQLTIFHCALKVKVNYIADVIKKSCKAIFYYNCLIIFSSALLVLHLLVFLFTAKVYNTLQMYTGVAIYHGINVIAGSYILLFITFFGQTVIARCIATCHWTTNSEAIPKSVLLKSITSTARYHIGTVAFGATLILPMMQAGHIYFKVKINEAENSDCPIIRMFTRVNLTMKIVDCALIQTAIRGHNFSQSTKRSFYLVMHNCSRYLAVTEAFTFVFYLIMTIMFAIVGLITYVMIQSTYNQHESYSFEQAFSLTLLIFWITCVMIFPYFYLLLTAVKTILLCTFDDVLENDESRKKSYLMNVQLHKMPTE